MTCPHGCSRFSHHRIKACHTTCMGIEWSHERVPEALETFEVLVWNSSMQISESLIQAILAEYNVTQATAIARIKDRLKEKELEQKDKSRFFEERNVQDLADFHKTISNRYWHVGVVLLLRHSNSTVSGWEHH